MPVPRAGRQLAEVAPISGMLLPRITARGRLVGGAAAAVYERVGGPLLVRPLRQAMETMLFLNAALSSGKGDV